MNTKILIAVYILIISVILILMLITGKKNAAYYKKLDKKEHPLRSFYPAAAYIYGKSLKLFGKKTKPETAAKIKMLYVKENISEEYYLFMLKKISAILSILAAVSMLGIMVCASALSADNTKTLERGDYGKGKTSYELELEAGEIQETVQIDLDAVKHTDEEIEGIFEAAYEPVKKAMLGENESADNVNKPLNFITEYNGIDISWDSDSPDIVGYDGEAKLKEENAAAVNIFAEFSMEGKSEIYAMPITVTAKEPDEKEKLINEILESIDEENNIYAKEVVLPEEADGKKLTFKKIEEHNAGIFLVLGIAAVIVIAFGYEKTLDKKLKQRKEQMLLDFTEIVSKLSLLYEAGLSILKAWERIVEEYEADCTEEHFAYREMAMTLKKIKSGASEREAYYEFGKRCGLHPYLRLGNILEQNLSKGTKGIKLLLKQEVEDAFEQRKKIALKRGEEASTKLIFPMVIMLIIVIAIIAVPALMSMQL